MIVTGRSVFIKPKYQERIKQIEIPESYRNKPISGIVMDCSADCKEIKKGDEVLYRLAQASIYTYEGVDYHALIETDILAKIIDNG